MMKIATLHTILFGVAGIPYNDYTIAPQQELGLGRKMKSHLPNPICKECSKLNHSTRITYRRNVVKRYQCGLPRLLARFPAQKAGGNRAGY